MSFTILFTIFTLGLAWLYELRRADRLDAALRRIETELARHETAVRDRRFARDKR